MICGLIAISSFLMFSCELICLFFIISTKNITNIAGKVLTIDSTFSTTPNTNASGTIGAHIGVANNASRNIFALTSFDDITDGTHYISNPFLEVIEINSNDTLSLLYQYQTGHTRQQDSMNNTPVIKLSNDSSVAMVGGRFTTRGFSIFKNGSRQSTGADEFFYENVDLEVTGSADSKGDWKSQVQLFFRY